MTIGPGSSGCYHRLTLRNQSLVAFVSATDPTRAKAFYKDTLGLTLLKEELPFLLLFESNGSLLSIHLVGSQLVLAPYTVLGWDVMDIEAEIGELTAKGVKFERFPGMEQDTLGIWTAPGGAAQVAWFKDPDGNILSLSQQHR